MRALSRYIVTVLMLTACDDVDVHEVDEVNDFNLEVAQADWVHAISSDTEARPRQDESEADAILVEIAVGDRGSIRFIDERRSFPDGSIGLLAQGASRLLSSAQDQGLSPLELYMALAPGAESPRRLQEHHIALVEAQGRASAVPREFRVSGQSLTPIDQLAAPLPEPLRSQETDSWDCSSTDGISEWQVNFMLWMLSIAGVFELDWYDTTTASGNVDVYPGAATERWLGACPKSNSHVSWMVQAKVGTIWLDVVGTSLSLAVDHDVRYYSETDTVKEYRAHITNAAGDSTKVGAGRRTM
jgi:hypothetical protein